MRGVAAACNHPHLRNDGVKGPRSHASSHLHSAAGDWARPCGQHLDANRDVRVPLINKSYQPPQLTAAGPWRSLNSKQLPGAPAPMEARIRKTIANGASKIKGWAPVSATRGPSTRPVQPSLSAERSRRANAATVSSPPVYPSDNPQGQALRTQPDGNRTDRDRLETAPINNGTHAAPCTRRDQPQPQCALQARSQSMSGRFVSGTAWCPTNNSCLCCICKSCLLHGD